MAAAPVRRWVKHSGKSVHLDTSANRSVMRTRGSMVKSLGQSFGFGRRRFFERRYLQHAFVDCDIRQETILGANVDGRQSSVEHLAAARDESFEIRFDRNRQGANFPQILKCLLRNQSFLERAVLSAAADPYVASAQPIPELG